MTTVNVDVDYSSGTTPSITFSSNGGPWDSTVDYDATVTFSLTQSAVSNGFSFYGLTLWYGGTPDDEPAETFVVQKATQSGGTYNGVTVSGITVSASSVQFTVENGCTAGEDMILDVEVLIQDSTTSEVYTSRDPQITLDKPPT